MGDNHNKINDNKYYALYSIALEIITFLDENSSINIDAIKNNNHLDKMSKEEIDELLNDLLKIKSRLQKSISNKKTVDEDLEDDIIFVFCEYFYIDIDVEIDIDAAINNKKSYNYIKEDQNKSMYFYSLNSIENVQYAIRYTSNRINSTEGIKAVIVTENTIVGSLHEEEILLFNAIYDTNKIYLIIDNNEKICINLKINFIFSEVDNTSKTIYLFKSNTSQSDMTNERLKKEEKYLRDKYFRLKPLGRVKENKSWRD